MEEKILNSLTRRDFRKLLIATLVFFFLFVLIDKQVNAPVSMIQVDYFALGEEKSEHPSANLVSTDQFLLDFLCGQQKEECGKIIYSGSLSEADKLEYVSQYLTIFSFIDRSLTKGETLKNSLKTFILNATKGKRRGGATASRITINLDSMGDKQEYRGVLTHEFGHIVDLGALQGFSKHKDPHFTEFGKVKFAIDDPSLEYYRYSRASEQVRQEQAEKSDFCSGYGMTNPFEDFAECHNLYLNNESLFRQMAAETLVMKNKYNYLANLFAAQQLQKGNAKLLYRGWRPWDTTLLYE